MDIEKQLLISQLQNKLVRLIKNHFLENKYYSIEENNYFNILENKYQNNIDEINFIAKLKIRNFFTQTQIQSYLDYLQIYNVKNTTLIIELFNIFDLNNNLTEKIESLENDIQELKREVLEIKNINISQNRALLTIEENTEQN